LVKKKAGRRALLVFPFVSNKSRAIRRGQEHYLSEPYAGDSKVSIRGDKIRQINLQYLGRHQEEFDVAEAFHGQHYPDPTKHFIYRDYNFTQAEIFKADSRQRSSNKAVRMRLDLITDLEQLK
jgi:hypothetical protein